MTIANRYPPKVFLLMLDIANKNGIPVKRVETILLHKAIADMGFTCDHLVMGIRKSDKKPFCKDCWTIFRQLKSARFDPDGNLIKAGEYVIEPTFLDNEKDDTLKEQVWKLAGPPRKYTPRFKMINLPSGVD